MPSLKDLKNRIASVKSTRKITSAMKMVAASKLRRAQDQAEFSRPYARRMTQLLADLARLADPSEKLPPLLVGNGKEDTVLLIVMTSDRGLCGAFNGSVIREARAQIRGLEAEGKKVKLICLGRKGRDLLRREHGEKFLFTAESSAKKAVELADAREMASRIGSLFEEGAFDIAKIVYNQFKSAISQVVTVEPLIPFVAPEQPEANAASAGPQALFEIFEPSHKTLLEKLLPRHLEIRIFRALLESAAGEQGARMTAMDNATRNAGDMIDRLTLNYNRSRQAYITKELIEIISGAEAAA